MGNGIMLFCETSDGSLAKITAELAGAGRNIADQLGEELQAVLFGSGVKAYAQELISLGIDKVYVFDAPVFDRYQAGLYGAAMEDLLKDPPSILLFGHTETGRDLAPRLGFRLKAGIVMDCIKVEVDANSKKLLLTHPIYGSKANARFASKTEGLLIASLRAKSCDPAEKDENRQGNIIEKSIEVGELPNRIKVIDQIRDESAGVKLEQAGVIVSGGRGMQGPEGFETLKRLALVLGGETGGAVGASRAAVDNGWAPNKLQVGQTGKIVSPNIYVAVGISGAMQHIAGCATAKNIIAVNKDPEAPIFNIANYGVVGTWEQIIPAFTEKCEALK